MYLVVIIVENKQNYRIIEFGDGEWVEIWEQDGKEQVLRHGIEDLLNDHTGEIESIKRDWREEYAIGDNPYENTYKDVETETEKGSEEQLPEEPE